MADTDMRLVARGALALLTNLRRFQGQRGSLGPMCTLDRPLAHPGTVVYTLRTATDCGRLWGDDADDDLDGFAVLVLASPFGDMRGIAALSGWLPPGYLLRLTVVDGASARFQPFEIEMGCGDWRDVRAASLLLTESARTRTANLTLLGEMLTFSRDAVAAKGMAQALV